MNVIDCGTRVKTNIGSLEAIVTSISIRFGKAAYEVSYFHNGEYKSPYLNETEFTVIDTDKKHLKIGYK